MQLTVEEAEYKRYAVFELSDVYTELILEEANCMWNSTGPR